jgi:PIN domain nuclease of toxin-antitoxin system
VSLLLDTHVAIWAVADSQRLPATIQNVMLQADAVCVSSISILEIAVKYALARPGRPPFDGHEAHGLFERAGFQTLPLTARHAAAVDRLPLLHGDPFDRVLVAQTLEEQLQLLSKDPAVVAYSASFLTW